MRSRKRSSQIQSSVIWGALGLATLGLFGFLVYNAIRPPAGEAVEIVSREHVPEPTPPGPFNTDPPTSGAHYADTFEPGFYSEEDLASLPPHPAGYLVHNLEHDYSIVWYNCSILTQAECDSMVADIRQALEAMSGSKLIAFPWSTQAEPVVFTHWGRILRFEAFDARALANFHRANLGRAPEPNAP